MWLKKPFKEKTRITSRFGYRKHPITGKKSFHKGVDIGLLTGTKIFAPLEGHFERRIDGKGLNGGFGRYCILKCVTRQKTKVKFIFAHLSKWCVPTGNVKKGQLIALTGNSGSSTNDHLHFEIRIFNGKKDMSVNPINFIDFV